MPVDGPNGWVGLATLTRSWGRRGELSAVSHGSGIERFEQLGKATLFDVSENNLGEFGIEKAWEHKGALILKFEGVDSITDAEKLESAEVRIPISERPALAPGEYYESDLIGCAVVDAASGREYGVLDGFADTGGPRLMVLASGMLIPYVPAICVKIEVVARRIEVDLPPGLDEL